MLSASPAITVARCKTFAGNEWRNAITHFVNGIMGNSGPFVRHPEISFGPSTLFVDRTPVNYPTVRVWGSPVALVSQPPDRYRGTHLICWRPGSIIEDLLSFVHNDSYGDLDIVVKSTHSSTGKGNLRLWKGSSRGVYYVTGMGIGQSEDNAAYMANPEEQRQLFA